MSQDYNYSITFTDGDFEKTIYAPTLDRAKKEAKDVRNWPLEISDYRKMYVTIQNDDLVGELVLNYEDLQ